MKYTILIYETETASRSPTDTGRKDAYWCAYRGNTQALTEAGMMAGGAPIKPAHLATTIRTHHGKRQVQDGPYAEAKDQLGGYYVIDVPDLDTALEWAARCPAA